MKEKVSIEQATQEVNGWMDFKKIFPTERERNKEHVDTLVEAIQFGVITIDPESKVITHNLLFPIGDGNVPVLEYQPRLNDLMLKPFLKNVDPKDGDERVVAHIAGLTGKGRGILHHLNDADKRIAIAIVVFFT